VFTAEDFKASKPDPDCYLRAAAAFGLEKDRCVVFEDAPNGLEAGRRSGIFTVGVATGLTKEQITPLCDAVVEDYRGFTTEALERIVAQKKERKNGQE
jgi:beta-phosphoglucomutase-like phosphatase (HAD superfamily)